MLNQWGIDDDKIDTLNSKLSCSSFSNLMFVMNNNADFQINEVSFKISDIKSREV